MSIKTNQSLQDKYKSKTVTIDDALGLVKSGNSIVTSCCASEPQNFCGRLHELKGRVNNVKVFGALSLKSYPFMEDSNMADTIEYNSWFYGPGNRIAQNLGGNITNIPGHLHNIFRRTAEVEKLNIYISTCTPVDKHGYVKLSMGLIYDKIMMECCDLIIMEINPNLPNVWGDTAVHIDEIDYFIETNMPVPILPNAPMSEVDLAIGKNVASLINDGDTLQFGIGAIPNAVAKSLTEKNNLGIHSEMIPSCIVDLVEAGAVNCRLKSLHRGKIIGSFILGERRLYDFVDNNPMVQLMHCEYVNNPFVIAQNDNMVSINTSIQVDLTGQCFSEGIGHRMYSGSGGQNDTAEGAIHAKNGRSIICLPSTTKNETLSTIVPSSYVGGVVTLSRNNIDYVVTEYGVALLKGLSIKNKAKNLIQVSHPKFRDELTEFASKEGLL